MLLWICRATISIHWMAKGWNAPLRDQSNTNFTALGAEKEKQLISNLILSPRIQSGPLPSIWEKSRQIEITNSRHANFSRFTTNNNWFDNKFTITNNWWTQATELRWVANWNWLAVFFAKPEHLLMNFYSIFRKKKQTTKPQKKVIKFQIFNIFCSSWPCFAYQFIVEA